MANTYTQIYVHVIFAVEGRYNLIRKEYKENIHRYITGIVKGKDQKVIAINSMPDHAHILIGLRPDMALSDLVRDIKAGSSKYINENKWAAGRLNWQEGFVAFSYSHSQLDVIAGYISEQEKHHAKRPFREEYIELLKRFNVDYNPKYVFDWIDNIDNVE